MESLYLGRLGRPLRGAFAHPLAYSYQNLRSQASARRHEDRTRDRIVSSENADSQLRQVAEHQLRILYDKQDNQ